MLLFIVKICSSFFKISYFIELIFLKESSNVFESLDLILSVNLLRQMRISKSYSFLREICTQYVNAYSVEELVELLGLLILAAWLSICPDKAASAYTVYFLNQLSADQLKLQIQGIWNFQIYYIWVVVT